VDDRTALVIGATGLSGGSVARHLADSGWVTYGVSRTAPESPGGIRVVALDVLDADAVRSGLAPLRPTHVFYCTWSRRPTEAENCLVNAAMLRNVLDALPDDALRHVALVTGLKHYLGPFEAYAQTPAETPFREEHPRVPYRNFYYDQEDVLLAAAEERGFAWSVHRPHTMIGWAVGNAMNMGVTLALYGSICRETGEPFVFPGSPQQYNGVTDITDARLLAKQLVWAATTPAAANHAYNTVNGDVFRWRQMWPLVAAGLGVEPAPYPGHAQPLEPRLAGRQPVWDKIVAKYGLVRSELDRLASWWHTDGDLGREMEAFADMSKSRRLGFVEYQDSARSFLDLFDALRAQRLIPPLGA
jgi:nucleoside-diphosphate-sugar epimerase